MIIFQPALYSCMHTGATVLEALAMLDMSCRRRRACARCSWMHVRCLRTCHRSAWHRGDALKILSKLRWGAVSFANLRYQVQLQRLHVSSIDAAQRCHP